MLKIDLPTPQGTIADYRLVTTDERACTIVPAFNRIAYAAAHVVIDPRHQCADWLNNPRIDWDSTLAYRHHLWRLGFNIAEAMDTAQRGMGVSWNIAQELIVRSLKEAKTVPGADLAAGVVPISWRLLPRPHWRRSSPPMKSRWSWSRSMTVKLS